MFNGTSKVDHRELFRYTSIKSLQTNPKPLIPRNSYAIHFPSRDTLRHPQMDQSFQIQDKPYQFWSLPLPEEGDHLSLPSLPPPLAQFGTAYSPPSKSPDPFFPLEEMDSYSSSRSSPRQRTTSPLIDWDMSEPVQFPMPGTSPSARRRSEPEKEAMSPAQSRRRSQNRTAQRAFRERKGRHIKELEAKIARLEDEFKSVGGENERLKKEISQLKTKNSTLRITSDHDDLDHYVEYASWRAKQMRL